MGGDDTGGPFWRLAATPIMVSSSQSRISQSTVWMWMNLQKCGFQVQQLLNISNSRDLWTKKTIRLPQTHSTYTTEMEEMMDNRQFHSKWDSGTHTKVIYRSSKIQMSHLLAPHPGGEKCSLIRDSSAWELSHYSPQLFTLPSELLF